ncbi:MAG: carbohydrate ABC transporter permease [Anaerolineae bacterium]|nr:carbohydrate ABC transporter permease [Anaerolineae bacterium]
MIREKQNPFVWLAIRLPILLLALTMIIPYYYMTISSFKTVQELKRYPPTFWPQAITLNNFYDPTPTELEHTRGLFQYFDKTSLRFGRILLNSLFIAVVNPLMQLLLASMVAYVLAKRRVPGGNFIFLFILASWMIPWPVTLIPNFLTISSLKWVNTYAGLMVPGWVSAFAVFFLRQYMLSIPDELVDAARIDGAGELRIWWQVVMPLATPALAALGVFAVLGSWNNFVWPLIVAQDNAHFTVPVAMAQLSTVLTGATAGAVMLGALLSSLLPMAFFFRFQKEFVENIAMTGVKG